MRTCAGAYMCIACMPCVRACASACARLFCACVSGCLRSCAYVYKYLARTVSSSSCVRAVINPLPVTLSSSTLKLARSHTQSEISKARSCVSCGNTVRSCRFHTQCVRSRSVCRRVRRVRKSNSANARSDSVSTVCA